MIDVHSHILPFVDDGSSDYNSSVEMLKDSVAQGVTDVFLTPHYRLKFDLSPEQINLEFEKFNKLVKDADIPINLYLGQEIYIDKNYKNYFSNGNLITLNNSKYVLIEFSYAQSLDYAEVCYEIIRIGYIPIVAHIERYSRVDVAVASEIKGLGGLIQINADSLVDRKKRQLYKLVKKLINNDLVDFVASDIHSNRVNYMCKAKKLVIKKFGQEIADKIFAENARRIIEG